MDQEDLAAKQHARDFAEKFLEDTQQEIRLGSVAGVDMYRAEADLRRAIRIWRCPSRPSISRWYTIKDLISREGTEDPVIASVQIVALDHIEVRAVENCLRCGPGGDSHDASAGCIARQDQ